MADLKTRLMQLLDLEHAFQLQFFADFPGEAARSGTWEQWSLKDELAHIIAWQLNSLARIAALMHAEPVPDFNDYERLNRAIFDTNRDRSLAEIAAEGDRARADFVAHLIATAEQAPQTRSLRRATPADAQTAYRACQCQPAGAGSRTRQIV